MLCDFCSSTIPEQAKTDRNLLLRRCFCVGFILAHIAPLSARVNHFSHFSWLFLAAVGKACLSVRSQPAEAGLAGKNGPTVATSRGIIRRTCERARLRCRKWFADGDSFSWLPTPLARPTPRFIAPAAGRISGAALKKVEHAVRHSLGL